MKKRALIHVEDTRNLEELALFLNKDQWQLLSADSTEDFLRTLDVPVTHESALEKSRTLSDSFYKMAQQLLSTQQEYTGSFGEVTSLSHLEEENELILVCMNFTPRISFVSQEHQFKALQQPEDFLTSTILRIAFYNSKNVIILTDPEDYREAMIQLRNGSITPEFKAYLGAKALNMISAYDAGIAYSLLHAPQVNYTFMNYLTIPYTNVGILHYGSNKNQLASIYNYPAKNSFEWNSKNYNSEQANYNTINDLALAWKQICSLYQNLKNMFTVQSTNADGYAFTTQFTPLTGTVFTIAIKFNSIIGAALSSNAIDSFQKTNCFDKDIQDVSLGFSSIVDEAAAVEILKGNYCAVIAPDFTEEATKILNQNSKVLTIRASNAINSAYSGKIINGGLIVQLSDTTLFNNWSVKTRNRPNQQQTDAMAFGTMLTLGTPSYSAVLLKEKHIIGIAQGCTSNKKAVQYAVEEANGTVPELLVSDTPITFTEEIKKLIDSGLQAIIQPGGTADDEAFTKYCDEHNTVMVFTNMTHINI